MRPNANQKLDYTATGDLRRRSLRQTALFLLFNSPCCRRRMAPHQTKHNRRSEWVRCHFYLLHRSLLCAFTASTLNSKIAIWNVDLNRSASARHLPRYVGDDANTITFCNHIVNSGYHSHLTSTAALETTLFRLWKVYTFIYHCKTVSIRHLKAGHSRSANRVKWQPHRCMSSTLMH